MPYYRQVGDVPRKRHTQFRQPDGSLYAEELMGVRGFLLRLVAALPPARSRRRSCPRGVRRRPPFDPAAQPPAQAAPPARPTSSTAPAAADPVLGRQHLLANADVRISYVRRRPAVAAVPQRDRRRVRLRRERQRGRRDRRSARSTRSPGDYVVIPTSTIHRWVPPAASRALLVTEASGHIGPPSATCRVRASSSSTRRTASATCAGRTSRCTPTARTSRCSCSTAARAARRLDALRLRPPPVRRGRLGRLPVPLGVLHPRLRADHRPAAPAAAGAPDLRGPELRRSARSCRACSTTTRTASRRRTTTPTSTPTRCIFYTGGDFEAAQGLRHRAGSISLHPSGFTHGPQPGAAEALDRRGATSTSWRSWSTRSARSTCCDPALAARTRRTPGPGPGGASTPRPTPPPADAADQRRRPLRRRRAGTTNSTTSTTSAMRISRVSTGPPGGRRSTDVDRLTDPEGPLPVAFTPRTDGRTTMFENTKAFSGFSVDDIDAARQFYGETLGLEVSEANGMLTLHIAGDRRHARLPEAATTSRRRSRSSTSRSTTSRRRSTSSPSAGSTSSATREPTIETDEKGIFRGGGPPSPGSRTRPATSCRWSRTEAPSDTARVLRD